MKVVVFNGSPRIGGNIDTLVGEALRPIEDAGHETATFRLNEMRIRPCQDCGGCTGSGRCVQADDMAAIADAIRASDRFVLASPIFFFGLSAQAKTMIDRCQAFWCEKYLLKQPIPEGEHGRKGLLLLVGGMKKRSAPSAPGRRQRLSSGPSAWECTKRSASSASIEKERSASMRALFRTCTGPDDGWSALESGGSLRGG